MATEKWITGSGQGISWGPAFTGSTLNSIPSGNAILSDIVIANGSALDIFADLSINLASVAWAAPFFIGVYLYPANDVGTYGDGRFSPNAAGPPPSTYNVGSIALNPTASIPQTGVLSRIVLPPGNFKFVLYNQGGVAFTTGNTCLYRTYNRQIV
jgi:hypothetical protein